MNKILTVHDCSFYVTIRVRAQKGISTFYIDPITAKQLAVLTSYVKKEKLWEAFRSNR